MNINVQDENVELSASSNTITSSGKRLEKALNYIEDFLKDQNNQLQTPANLENKDIVLANLDILISRMQDILQQFDNVE